jgi:hypothetical protein
MSELLVTQTELDAYLASIDLTDPAVVRVLNGIQLLSPTIYNEILYCLISGSATIPQVDAVPMNNRAVKDFIDSILNGGGSSSALALKKYYKQTVESFTRMKEAITTVASSSPQFFQSYFFPTASMIKTVTLDSTAMAGDGSFPNLASLRKAYTAIVSAYFGGSAWAVIEAKCAAAGYSRVASMLRAEIEAYGLVATADGKIGSSAPVNASLIGFIGRGLHNFSWRIDFLTSFDKALDRMVAADSRETARTGVEGARDLFTEYDWNRIYNGSDAKSIIASFPTVCFARRLIPSIYEGAGFSSEELAAETEKLQTLINEVFDPLESAVTYLRTTLASQLVYGS